MSLSVGSKQSYFVSVDTAGSNPAILFQENYAALHEKGESTEGGINRDRLIITWSPTGKSVELYMSEKGSYYMRVKVGQKESIVPKEDITGVALRHLENAASLEMVQKVSFVTLNLTSDQSYKVTIHARGMGGVPCLGSMSNLAIKGIKKYTKKSVNSVVKATRSCLGLQQGVRVAQIESDGKKAVAQIKADGKKAVAQIKAERDIEIEKERTKRRMLEVLLELRRDRMEA